MSDACCFTVHRNRICHRDIKPENILLSSAEEGYKLADFGVAHMLEPEDGDQAMLRSTEGTYHFLAPECTTGEAYDPFQVDIWALGVTMFAMLRGTLPFGTKAASLDDVMTSIREDALVLTDDLAPECAELLARMLAKNPSERITIPQLLAHPWLSGASAVPSTPRDGGDSEAPQEEEAVVVQVSAMEVEAAFTPVNNFILMTKLKMKMGTRLARVRKSIDSRQELFGNGGADARRLTQPHAPAVHPHTYTPHHRSSDSALTPVVHPLSDVSDAPRVVDKNDEGVGAEAAAGDGKICEVSPSEVSPGKLAALLGLQRRKGSLAESLAGTMDALASLKPTTLLRRNSALAASSTATASSKPEAQTMPLDAISPLGPAIESALLIALSSNQPGTPHVDPLAEGGSHLDTSTPEASALALATTGSNSANSAVPDANSSVDGSRSAVALTISTTADEDPVDSQPPQASQWPNQQPRFPRRGLSRRSSTVAARIGGAGESAQASSPTFSDIAGSAKLMRRKSALVVVSPTKSTGSSCRSRNGSPSKTARLGKLEMLPEKVAAHDHQARADASSELQHPCNGLDAREEAGVAFNVLMIANMHDEDGPKVEVDADVAVSHTTRALAALTPNKEGVDSVEHSTVKPIAGCHALSVDGEGDPSSRPQSPSSPRSRRRSSALGSHPTLQTKLPPLDLSSAPCTPTTRSPTTSPVASGSPKRSRRASVDFPLQFSEVDELAAADEGQALSARLSPSRRHSLLERQPQGLEYHALPAFAGSLAALSTPSSPRVDALNRRSEVEFSLESGCHGELEEQAIPTAQALAPDGEDVSGTDQGDAHGSAAIASPDRHALGLVKPSVSLSTPHLPRYHSPVPPALTLDALQHHSTLEGESARNLTGSSSTGSLSPRHKLPPPSRYQVAPSVGALTTGDLPNAPSEATASMVRMSSLAKALDTCLPPEDNAAYYSFRSTPQPPPSADADAQETPGATEDPRVDAEETTDVLAPPKRRNSSHWRSLLEAQDSLRLMVHGHSSANLSAPFRPANVLQRLGWGANGGASDAPLTSVCVLM